MPQTADVNDGLLDGRAKWDGFAKDGQRVCIRPMRRDPLRLPVNRAIRGVIRAVDRHRENDGGDQGRNNTQSDGPGCHVIYGDNTP